jgi:hypothetical protein
MEFFLLLAAIKASYLAVTAALSLSSVLANFHTLNLNTSQFTYWFYIICFNAD